MKLREGQQTFPLGKLVRHIHADQIGRISGFGGVGAPPLLSSHIVLLGAIL